MKLLLTSKTLILLIIPFGPVPKEILNFLQAELAKVFNLDVRIAKPEPIPQHAFNPKRGQYYSSRILEGIKKLKAKDELVLGVIDADLYVPELNFVFGEADIFERVCIISLTRLYSEYYGKPKDDRLFLERALKEAVHEIGHTFGLGHCKDQRCIMFFSNSIKDTDKKGPGFCVRCLAKLHEIKS